MKTNILNIGKKGVFVKRNFLRNAIRNYEITLIFFIDKEEIYENAT